MPDITDRAVAAAAVETPLDVEIPPRPEGRDAMVRFAMLLMAAGRWERGVTGERLAAAWGLSVDYLRKIAAEASRRVLDAIDPVAVRQRLAHAFGRSVDVLEGKLDGEDAIEAARCLAANASSYAALVGAGAPQKRDITITEAKDTAWFRAEIESQARFLCEADARLAGFLARYEAGPAWAEWCAELGCPASIVDSYLRQYNVAAPQLTEGTAVLGSEV